MLALAVLPIPNYSLHITCTILPEAFLWNYQNTAPLHLHCWRQVKRVYLYDRNLSN